MSVPFPEGPYEIVNYQNGKINTVNLGEITPVVADSTSAIFAVSNYQPHDQEHIGFEIHHLVNILERGQPANLKLTRGVAPSDKTPGIVAIYTDAVPNVWCIHPAEDGETNKYLIYFSLRGTINHGACHWQLKSSVKGTYVTVNTDEDHPVNQALGVHIKAGRGASLVGLTQNLKELEKHHPDCFWHFNKCPV